LNRYKISFIALDGTDEADMICFGDVARRIIGKSVQQLLRIATNSTTYPPEVARIVSLRFTFAVTAYGRQPIAAALVES
jgi:replication factor A1